MVHLSSPTTVLYHFHASLFRGSPTETQYTTHSMQQRIITTPAECVGGDYSTLSMGEFTLQSSGYSGTSEQGTLWGQRFIPL